MLSDIVGRNVIGIFEDIVGRKGGEYYRIL